MAIFPRMYDALMTPLDWLGLRRRRREMVSEARGLVLEIGIGTGLNLPFYTNAGRVIGVEPDRLMLNQARGRAARLNIPLVLISGIAENLPFQDEVFDTAVSTLVFCTVPDPVKGFQEMRRVLKKSGRFLLLEHVRGRSRPLGRLQDGLTPVWRRMAGGCHLNRPSLELAREAGFSVERVGTSLDGVLLRAVLRPAGAGD